MGSRKSTAFAAQRAGEDAAKKAMDEGVRKVDVFVIVGGSIKDVTPIPHNGCRPPKRSRV